MKKKPYASLLPTGLVECILTETEKSAKTCADRTILSPTINRYALELQRAIIEIYIVFYLLFSEYSEVSGVIALISVEKKLFFGSMCEGIHVTTRATIRLLSNQLLSSFSKTH